MAEKLNTTRRAVLSGLAAAPFVTVPVLGSPGQRIGLAEALAAIRDHMDLAVPVGHGWTLTMGQDLEGVCHEQIVEVLPFGPMRREILTSEDWA